MEYWILTTKIRDTETSTKRKRNFKDGLKEEDLRLSEKLLLEMTQWSDPTYKKEY